MKKTILTLLTINILSQPLLVNAADTVTLNFTGNIKAATCNISGGNNIDIDLKRLPIDIFNSAQTGSDWKNFDIHLNNCSSFINQIKLTFAGTSDAADMNSLYKNLGTAQNIAVQLQSGDGATPLGNLKTLQVPLNGQSDIAIPLRARAFSMAGNVVAGSISANVTATITYL
ncbi:MULTISPECIES: fimbrial protein [Providencia]|uniref:Type 1 fimbrial protein n=1 Tax=Providencia huaxiensis TaxID=2027290 RepID=A0ABU2ISG1_9GAMM|nr:MULTISPECIES: fimbrial protein [Providencia]MBZ3680975.1 type 1 fimbrial protein [Providencia rettgeri]AXH63185.1 type 1 fimbrial protein [Providencia huaxiensis]MDT0132013.1 type 1 fimbrial protein [Providencia huaxiensis]MDT1978419.1 type 1 fimbrial protein [Providencia huaxiensis]QLR01552.1 type 1 fimbrial protein [Providencia rettgeri]